MSKTKAKIELFDINGQSIFPVYGNSGGINAEAILYFVEKSTHTYLAVRVPPMDGVEIMRHLGEIRELAEKHWDKDARKIQVGDDLGVDGLDLRQYIFKGWS